MQYEQEAGAHGRFGYVSAYDPVRHMARVSFPDKDDMVSAWLPVAVSNTKNNKDEHHLDIGEHVYCNMMGNGLEAGIVLGAFWDDTNKPPAGNKDIWQKTFEDGTTIKVDRKEHIVEVEDSYESSICFKEGGIFLKAPKSISIECESGGGQSFTMDANGISIGTPGDITIVAKNMTKIDAQEELLLRSKHIRKEKNNESEGGY